jgi:TolB-like protein
MNARSFAPMLRAALLLPAAAALAAATPRVARAQADARPTVAVLFFNNGSFGPGAKDYDMLGRGVADFLITELSTNAKIRVVERDQIAKLTAEQDLGTSGRVDAETAVRLGKLLGAQYMVTGGFIVTPKGDVRLDSRAIQVETSRIVHTESVTDKSDNFVPLIGKLAEKLNSGMKLPELPKRVGSAAPAPGGAAGAPAAEQKVPFAAVALYSKAIGAKDRGNKQEAVTLFKAALEKFPEFTKAKTELKSLGG